MPRLALLSAAALLVLPLAATPAIAEAPAAPEWVRAVGRAHNLNVKSATITGFGFVCSTPLCTPVDATITMKVDAATQRRYKLPSRTIATSTPFAPRGEGVFSDMKATAAMRKKLKLVKKKLPITTTLVVRSPIAATATNKESFVIGTTDLHRFCIGTAGDPLCGPGGSGGR
jgi:hypothetical protein